MKVLKGLIKVCINPYTNLEWTREIGNEWPALEDFAREGGEQHRTEAMHATASSIGQNVLLFQTV